VRTVSGYGEALRFLYSFVDYERRTGWKYTSDHFNLDRLREYLHTLGDPHTHSRFIHIAGTNGKGSVAAMTASALTEAGLKTGLYTSPHLTTFRERIRVNGSIISQKDVVKAVDRIKNTVGRFKNLTFFEVWTALAFVHFAENGLDISVIETGMGGRLDATNVITPEVSVLTSISIDHHGILGNNSEQIAVEKAGIIKPGVPVISAPQEKKVSEVIEAQAHDMGAELTMLGRDVRYDIVNSSINYSGVKWQLGSVSVPLKGAMQFENAALAIAALEALAGKGFPVDESSVRRGIEGVVWPGRLQYVAENPAVIVDGACNIEAMMAVVDYVRSKYSPEHTVAVVGMCVDKDIRGVLDVLGNAASRFVCTRVDNPRAIRAVDLAEQSPSNVETVVREDPVTALEHAVALAGSDGVVIATGSLYLVGDMLGYYGIGEHD